MEYIFFILNVFTFLKTTTNEKNETSKVKKNTNEKKKDLWKYDISRHIRTEDVNWHWNHSVNCGDISNFEQRASGIYSTISSSYYINYGATLIFHVLKISKASSRGPSDFGTEIDVHPFNHVQASYYRLIEYLLIETCATSPLLSTC